MMQELPADDKAKIISLVGQEVPQRFRMSQKDPFRPGTLSNLFKDFLHFVLSNDALGIFAGASAVLIPSKTPFLRGLASENALIEK